MQQFVDDIGGITVRLQLSHSGIAILVFSLDLKILGSLLGIFRHTGHLIGTNVVSNKNVIIKIFQISQFLAPLLDHR